MKTMKIVVMLVMCLTFLPAYSHAEAINSQSELDKVTVWNQMTDYVSTLGKTESEKKKFI